MTVLKTHWNKLKDDPQGYPHRTHRSKKGRTNGFGRKFSMDYKRKKEELKNSMV